MAEVSSNDATKAPASWSKGMVGAALVIVVSSFCYGYHLSVVNAPRGVFVDCQVQEGTGFFPNCVKSSPESWNLIVSMFPVGGLVGTLAAPACANGYGRRVSLLWNNIFFITGFLCMALATSDALLTTGRFLCGVASGLATSICPAYLGEISTLKTRGVLGSMHAISLVTGIFVAQALGVGLAVDGIGWRFLFGAPTVLCFLQVAAFVLWMPESPSFSARKGRTEEARSALTKIRPIGYDIDAELAAYAEANGSNGSEKMVGMLQLLRLKEARRSLLVALVLHVMLQLSGINGVFYFSVKVFNDTGNADIATVVSMGLGLANLVFSASTLYLLGRFGRRTLLLYGTAFQAVCSIFIVLSLALSWNIALIVFFYLYVGVFGISLGCIPWIIVSELFPMASVASASSLAVALNWTCNFIVGITFVPLITGLGTLFFLPFACILTLGTVFIYIAVPETRGRPPGYLTAKVTATTHHELREIA